MKTYGQVVLEKGVIRVTAEPHVLIRMKRVFHRIDKNERKAVSLSDTPENGRELLWFCERYPLEIDPAARAHLEARAAAHRKSEEIVQSILAGKYTGALPFLLALNPRQYQKEAAQLLLATGRLLLADDVGLGKTCSAICTFTDPRTMPALVVTLTHLTRQWQSEIAKFAPHLRTAILKKATPYDLTTIRGKRHPFPDVVISNYHKLAGWASSLAGKVRSVVFDEVQELRKTDSAKYKAAIHIAERASFRMGLSATPIYNYGGEFHAVLNALAPDSIGSPAEFVREWCDGEDSSRDRAKVKNPKAFGSFLRDAGLMLRRTRAEVGRELPALTKVPHHIDADLGELDKIASSASELARIILAQGGLEKGAKLRASEELSWRLRQATGIAKAPFVAEFVRLLIESGEKVVLYGWHHEVYALWADRLADLAPAFYTGQESVPQKEEARRRFLSGETPLLIMSLRAGAGVDGLQGAARTVVFGEIDWSPGVHEQAIGRLHRDGQTEPVLAYFLLAESGSDPVVADVLGIKKAQIEGVRDPNLSLVEKLQTVGGHIRRLAEEYLRQRGESAPPAVAAPSQAANDAQRV